MMRGWENKVLSLQRGGGWGYVYLATLKGQQMLGYFLKHKHKVLGMVPPPPFTQGGGG